MMRLSIGYPSAEAEEAILHEQTSHDPLSELEPVLDASEVLSMNRAVTRVRVAPACVTTWWRSSRDSRTEDVYLGASPRAGIALLRAAKALALLRGRDSWFRRTSRPGWACVGHRLNVVPDAKVHG